MIRPTGRGHSSGYLQREIETTLGRKLLAGEMDEHSRVVVDWNGRICRLLVIPAIAEAA